MLTDRSWLDAPATRQLIAAFDRSDIDFRFVGGAVRDTLLGRPVADIDVATPATPDSVLKALAEAGLKAIPTGLAHGTVTAIVERRPFEITTLRRDVETDGRHAVVAFTDDWRADAARRDFTMNALYADRDGKITDFFGGEADARAGRVRFIGDPAGRIAEDALRILRFFRFHAWYGRDGLDRDGAEACAKLAVMIERLSGERVRIEIFKLLSSPNPVPVWRAMIGGGIMDHVLPGATQIDALSGMVALESGLGLPPDPIRRLAALLGSVAAGQLDWVRERLKLANHDDGRLRSGAKLADRVDLVARRAFGRALYGAQPDGVRDAAMLACVEFGQPEMATLAELCRFMAGWTEPRFPVAGADLIACGLKPGPALGHHLSELEAWWISSDFRPDRDACLARLRERGV